MKSITVSLILNNTKGKPVAGKVIIRDGLTVSTFSDSNLARQLFEYDRDKGEDVAFNEKHNAYIHRYARLSKVEILKLLKEELKQVGGEFQEEVYEK